MYTRKQLKNAKRVQNSHINANTCARRICKRTTEFLFDFSHFLNDVTVRGVSRHRIGNLRTRASPVSNVY